MKALLNKKLIFTLMLLIGLQWLGQSNTAEASFGENGVESVTLASKGRKTELGKPVVSTKKQEQEVEVLFNDPAISSGWGLKMTESQKAWRISQGSRDIIVAVIDTGCDTKHPDLQKNLWVNAGETGKDKFGRDKATNKVDDDGNGQVDDVNGWNFVANNSNLKDEHGHGTHICGIIGAEGGNGIGISGVSPKVSLMVLKYYDANGSEMNNLSNTVRAIDYAVKMNANIINYSGGGIAPSADEKAAIERAMKKGILFVAAAGNERSNSDTHAYYPADYGLPNILSVTAIDRFQNVLPSSNWGEKSVDIAAPGNDIISTLPDGKFGYMTGTSQATAFASGVAALVMANNPQLRKADDIKKYLTRTGDNDEKLAGKTRYQRRLNSYNALAIQDMDLAFNGTKVEGSGSKKIEFASENSADDEDQSIEPETKMASFGKMIQTHLSAGKAIVAAPALAPEARVDEE